MDSSREIVMNQSFAQDAFTAAELTYRSDQAPLPEGWKSVPPPKGMEADFKTAVCDHLVSPTGDHYIAFRGTTDSNDWKNNLGQGATAYRPQYDAAARIGEHFRDNRDQPGYDYNVTYAGHSLGGGKAQLAAEVASQQPNRDGAIAEPQTCVAVNAAPVHRDTYEAYGCDPHTHTCKTLELENEHDLLTIGREWTPTMAGSIVQSVHKDVANVVQGAAVVAELASGAANSIASGANTIASGVASGANAIKSGLTTGANTIASGANTVASGVASGANTIATGAHTAAKGVASAANTLAQGASAVAGVVATATANYAPSSVYNVGARFLTAGYNAAASLGSAGYNVASGLGAAAASVANAGYQVGASGAALGKSTVASVGSTVASVGSAAVSVGSKVASTVASVGSTVGSAAVTVGSTVGTAAVVGGAALYAARNLPDHIASAALERSSINEARLQSDRYNVKIAGSGAVGTVRDPATGHYMTSFDKNDSKAAGKPTQISYDIRSVQAYGGLQPVQSNDLSAFDHLRPTPQRLLNAAVQSNSRGEKALEMTSKSVGR